jgi:hypothetical protein
MGLRRNNMKKIELLKTGVSLVVSFGVGTIVGNIIKASTPSDVKKIVQLCIGAGSLVLTGLAGDAASKYTEGKIDDAVNSIKDFLKLNKNDEEVEEDG